MFGSTEPPPAYDTYAQQLVGRGHGLPLWYPDAGEHEIGDVGYIDGGRFYRIFNILCPADDRLNSRGVPNGFIPLKHTSQPLISTIKHYLPAGQAICANSFTSCGVKTGVGAGGVQGSGELSYEFQCKGTRGAIAILGDSAQHDSVTNKGAFRKYMLENHKSWYEFARGLDFDVKEKDLILVSGCVKTSEWAIATFASQEKEHKLSISASYGSLAQATFSISSHNSTTVPVEQRTSPPPVQNSPPEERKAKNQCMFIEYFKLQYSNRCGATKLRSKAEGKDARALREYPAEWRFPWFGPSIRSATPPNACACQRTSTDVQPTDPLEHVLDYMLQQTGAELAIANSQELYVVCHPNEWPSDLQKHLSRSRPKVEIDNGVAVIAPTIARGLLLSTFPVVVSNVLPLVSESAPDDDDDGIEHERTSSLRRSQSTLFKRTPQAVDSTRSGHLLAVNFGPDWGQTPRPRAQSFLGVRPLAPYVNGVH